MHLIFNLSIWRIDKISISEIQHSFWMCFWVNTCIILILTVSRSFCVLVLISCMLKIYGNRAQRLDIHNPHVEQWVHCWVSSHSALSPPSLILSDYIRWLTGSEKSCSHVSDVIFWFCLKVLSRWHKHGQE